MEVERAEFHGVRRLAVGQEGPVVEHTADGPVGIGGAGLGGQGRGVWVNGLVEVPETKNG